MKTRIRTCIAAAAIATAVPVAVAAPVLAHHLEAEVEACTGVITAESWDGVAPETGIYAGDAAREVDVQVWVNSFLIETLRLAAPTFTITTTVELNPDAVNSISVFPVGDWGDGVPSGTEDGRTLAVDTTGCEQTTTTTEPPTTTEAVTTTTLSTPATTWTLPATTSTVAEGPFPCPGDPDGTPCPFDHRNPPVEIPRHELPDEIPVADPSFAG
jgi:hypothetical protein